MKAFKAFNDDWTCNGYQYKVGKTHTFEGDIELCHSGFHACENPFDVLKYYDLCGSKFAAVEADDIGGKCSDDSKFVCAKLTLSAELSLPDFITACVNWLQNKCASEKSSGGRSKVATSGDWSKVATSGDWSKVATSGGRSQVATSGDGSQVATSGYGSKVATSGYGSQVATSGDWSQVATSGYGSKVATSGYGSKVATSGGRSKVATSGDWSKVATSGDWSQVATSGGRSQVATSGDGSQVDVQSMDGVFCSAAPGTIFRAKKGVHVSVANFEGGECVGFVTGVAGRKGCPANRWLTVEGGKFVEVPA